MKFVATPSVGQHDHTVDLHKNEPKNPEMWEYIYDLYFEDDMNPRTIRSHLKRTKSNEKVRTI